MKISNTRFGIIELRGKIEQPIMSRHEAGFHLMSAFAKSFPHDAKK